MHILHRLVCCERVGAVFFLITVLAPYPVCVRHVSYFCRWAVKQNRAELSDVKVTFEKFEMPWRNDVQWAPGLSLCAASIFNFYTAAFCCMCRIGRCCAVSLRLSQTYHYCVLYKLTGECYKNAGRHTVTRELSDGRTMAHKGSDVFVQHTLQSSLIGHKK